MTNKDFFIALEELQQAKNIDKNFIIEALESALTAAYKKNYGQARSAEVRLNPEKNTIQIFSYLSVVDEVEDEDKEISLEDAQEINPKYKVGDIISKEESMDEFNRIAAQTAKQVIMQKIKEAEKQEMLSHIAEKEGTLVSASVKRIDGDNVYLDVAGSSLEGLLTERDCLPNDSFRVGDRIKVYVRYMKDEFKSGLLQVTRTNTGFVRKLFELEVPEIENGILEIVNIVRDPGIRTKIAIKANDRSIDIVGACVGNKGMRINSIINELHGEKIDIVPFSENVVEFISNSLSPAQINNVTLDEVNKSAKVLVPENKLSLAIGKGGHNVRLAARLTGWKIDVKPDESRQSSIDVVSGTNVILDDNDQDIFTGLDE